MEAPQGNGSVPVVGARQQIVRLADLQTLEKIAAMLKKIGGGTKALFQDDQPSSFTGDGDLNMKDAKEALKLNR